MLPGEITEYNIANFKAEHNCRWVWLNLKASYDIPTHSLESFLKAKLSLFSEKNESSCDVFSSTTKK